MTKTESAEHIVKTLAIESCEQWLQCEMAEGVRLAIPNTNNLIMVGPQEWIAKNVPGVEAMVEGPQPSDDQWIFDLAVVHELRGNGLYGPVTFSSTGLVDFVRAVTTRLAATTQASTAQAEELVRFCPHCASIGAIGAEYRDCCPDGGAARRIPKALAEVCRETFKLAISAAAATSSTDAQAAAEVRSQWISVDERLPENAVDVIILHWPYDNRENTQVANTAHHVDGVFYNEDGDDMHPPSHWMPLNLPALRAGDTGGAQ